MKRTLTLLGAAGLLGLTSQAHALSLNANASDEAVGVEATQTIFPTLQAGAGYLHSDDRADGTDVYSGRLLFTPYVPGIDLGVGARYQYQDSDFGDGGGVGLGGHLYVETPLPRVDVGGYGYVMPDDLTHGDIDSSYEYGLRARAHLVGNFHGYVGYRYLRTDFEESGERTLDKGPLLGVSLGF